MAKKKSAGCEYCSNYVYDEDYEYYVCLLYTSDAADEL